MIDLSRHIEYMLLQNDKVAVPELGTFIATYVPSTWIEEEALFLPPYRSVSFSNETEDCNEFLVSLSAKYNITIEEAGILCMEFTENILQELHDNGTSDIGSIGYFQQENDNLDKIFVPCQAGVATPSLYGLDSLTCIPMASSSSTMAEEEEKPSRRLTSISSEEGNIVIRINRHFANYVAAIAASIVLFFALTTPALNNLKPGKQKAETEIFMPKQPEETKPVAVAPKQQETSPIMAEPTKAEAEAESNTKLESATDATTESKAEPKAEKPTEVKTEAIAEVKASAKTETKSEAKAEVKAPAKATITPKALPEVKNEEYAVVVASVLSMKNAERYTKELMDRGYNACIQSTEKMTRVIIPGFSTKQEAYNKKNQMQKDSKEFESVWVMKLD